MPRLDPWRAAAALLAVIAASLLAAAIPEPVEPGAAHGEPRLVDHTQYFREANVTAYNGSATCIQCHYDEVVEVFHSYHYQMESLAADIAGAPPQPYGGKRAYNDYCGAIFWNGTTPINYVGIARLKAPPPGYENLTGTLIATGCSMCHGTTMGLPPEPTPTREQLGNIDCLACHALPQVYTSGPASVKTGLREVYRAEDGSLRYRVNLPAEALAASIIDVPASENCLACHAYSGGGPGYKRPNISPDLYAGGFDVHVDAGLSCVDCHAGEGHAFPTRAADTWNREPGQVAACESCHSSSPHGGLLGWALNSFHERVACQVCHVPVIAGGRYPTDVARDWSRAVFHAEAAKYEPAIVLEGNVTPVYAWYNGSRSALIYPSPVEPANGTLVYVEPLGSRDDPGAKIYPFKLHVARVPYSIVNKTLVPVKVGVVFATGNVTAAIEAGAEASGLVWDGEWATLVRYMQVDHGVRPAEEALHCLDCHGPTVRRMPWPELGYGHWPEVAGAAAAVALGAWWAWRRRG